MILCRSVAELRAWRKQAAGMVGFVPTMGALHAGHRSLLDRMRAECDQAVASIFVNPTQFGPEEDLARYPRPLEADLGLCQDTGMDAVFLPEPSEMYPPGATVTVDPGPLGSVLEGAARPGHFRGVATVVLKLLNIVSPDRAYFGEKDYQQLCVIRRLAADLDLAAAIVPCPTVREADGLALSSRNAYLSPAERAAAPFLHEALLAARHIFESGDTDAAHLIAAGTAVLNASPQRFELDYLTVADERNLGPVQEATATCRLLIAARLGTTRLIDNIGLVEPANQPVPAHLQGARA